MPGKPNFILLYLALFLIILCAGTAFAHKVNIFAYVEDGTVYAESYFPDGRPVENGTITVFAAKEKLLEGKTDEQGLFSFTVPEADSDLSLVLDAGMGHKSSFELKKSTLRE